MNKCFCGKLLSKHSCVSVIKKEQKALTAEDLMRSRFVAFKLCDIDYILFSFSSKTRPDIKEKKEILAWAKSVVFTKLEIVNVRMGMPSDSVGTVEFKAYYIDNNKEYFMHEISSFEKENELWKYVDGIFPS